MADVVRIPLSEVPAKQLQGGSWSKLVISGATVTGNQACLGYSHFPPGAVTQLIVHEAEEFVFVVKGRGELRLDDGAVPFEQHDALYVPPGVWHAVANTGDEEVVMVFGFPQPDYPPTKQRE